MGIDGSYSRAGFHQMFDEAKRYVGMRLQQAVPAVDADFNDLSDSLFFQLRRVIQRSLGEGSPFGNNGFKIAEAASNPNNFRVTGGDGTAEGAGQLFIAGLPARLPSNVDYISTSRDIHPQVTAVVPLVLTDDSANYVVNELAGRDLVPDIDFPGTTFAIVSNTANTITVGAGDLTAATTVDKFYRVNLTSPGGARTDEVYLDAFMDEESTAEDANLIHMLGGPPAPYQGALRIILKQLVKVAESGVTPAASFVDGVGRRHFYTRLAVLSRTAGAPITAAMIADARGVVARPGGTDLLASVSGIDGKVVAETDLYTVPRGKRAIPLMLVVRPTLVTAITVPPVAGGGVAAGADDVFFPEALTGMTALNKAFIFNARGLIAEMPEGSTFRLGIDTGATGTALTLEAQLFGREF